MADLHIVRTLFIFHHMRRKSAERLFALVRVPSWRAKRKQRLCLHDRRGSSSSLSSIFSCECLYFSAILLSANSRLYPLWCSPTRNTFSGPYRWIASSRIHTTNAKRQGKLGIKQQATRASREGENPS